MPVLFSQGHTLFFRTKHFRLGGVFILVEMSAFLEIYSLKLLHTIMVLQMQYIYIYIYHFL